MEELNQEREPRPGANWFDEEPAEGARPRPTAGLPAPRRGGPRRAEALQGQNAPGPSSRAQEPDARAQGPDTRGLIKRILFLAVALVGLYFIWPQLVQFFDAVPGLRTIKWFWFALMVLLEIACLACYWGMMRVTVHEPRWFVVATTQMASAAFSRIVPGGAASGGAVSYQMLTKAGHPTARTVTGLTATTLLSTAVLFTLPVLAVPAILGGAPVDPSLVHTLEIGVAIAALIVGAGALMLFTDRPLRWIGGLVQRVLVRLRKAKPPRPGLPDRLVAERDLVKDTLGDKWWVALPCSAGNWLFDFAALLAALAAVGATPRPSLVLLGYVVAALLGVIPLTPGGLGFVEVGLAATLGLAGVGIAEATTAVLAYRLISFWLPMPAGLLAYLLFRREFGSGQEEPVADGQAAG